MDLLRVPSLTSSALMRLDQVNCHASRAMRGDHLPEQKLCQGARRHQLATRRGAVLKAARRDDGDVDVRVPLFEGVVTS